MGSSLLIHKQLRANNFVTRRRGHNYNHLLSLEELQESIFSLFMLIEPDLRLFSARSSALLPASTSAIVLIDPRVIVPKALLDDSPVFVPGTAATPCILGNVTSISDNIVVSVLASGRDVLLCS